MDKLSFDDLRRYIYEHAKDDMGILAAQRSIEDIFFCCKSGYEVHIMDTAEIEIKEENGKVRVVGIIPPVGKKYFMSDITDIVKGE